MNKRNKKKFFFLFACASLLLSSSAQAYELFVYRPYQDKKSFEQEKRIFIHGEFFGHLNLPTTFPSYNDLSGAEDSWNYGFRNLIFLTDGTVFHAQLITHDDGNSRTKFDWHFSLRHRFFENLVLVIGHDSDHDSDHVSLINARRYYVNRNYLGLGFPIKKGLFYIEPFAWLFLPNTKHRVHLDLSGGDMRQEYGIRIGIWFKEKSGFHLQAISQADKAFTPGKAILTDLIIRIRIFDWLELSTGGSCWADLKTSPAGRREKFYKLIWGIALPF